MRGTRKEGEGAPDALSLCPGLPTYKHTHGAGGRAWDTNQNRFRQEVVKNQEVEFTQKISIKPPSGGPE